MKSGKTDPVQFTKRTIQRMLDRIGLPPTTAGEKAGIAGSTVKRALDAEGKEGASMRTICALADLADMEFTLIDGSDQRDGVDLDIIYRAAEIAASALRDQPNALVRLPATVVSVYTWLTGVKRSGRDIPDAEEGALAVRSLATLPPARDGSQG